ncbi:MAG: hypothetical protein KJZ86_03870 [Caldilineaceae bacterium]|nr:hypothetical protein [Caldilineaceae bacterium]
MIKLKAIFSQDAWAGILIAISVLAVGFVYALGHVYRAPDTGFSYDGRWHVVSFSRDCPLVEPVLKRSRCNTGRDDIQISDEITAIHGRNPEDVLRLEDYDTDLTVTPFGEFDPGQVVQIEILREGLPLTIEWLMPEISNRGQRQRLGTLWVFLPFWLAGTAVLLFLRPKDTRWRLLILQNYITGLWLAVGTVSYSQIFGSTYLSIGLSWVIMPIYLHLHILMPRPIQLKGKFWIPALYLFAGTMALLNMLVIVPLSSYFLALLVGIGGSILLLLLRTVRPALPAERAALNLMLLGIGISLLPGILLYLIPTAIVEGYTASPLVTLLVTVAIPIISFFYTYTLYKHRLGNQEVRANRALSFYSFIILYATLFVFVFVLAGQRINLDPELYTVTILTSTVYMLLAFATRPPFERFMNRVVYGTTYDPEHIVQQFANEIPRALNPTYLSALLSNQVMPSLLIRQSVLYWLVEEKAQRVYAEQVSDAPPVLERAIAERFQPYFHTFLADGIPDIADNLPKAFQWVRLAVPIQLDGRAVGLWLFGRRDPDDFYPQRDMDLLSTLGSQVGIALESTRLFAIEQHRADELERTNFELHRAIRVKNDMLRNISHELRTPLTAISGYTDLLLDGVAGDLSKDQKELLSIVADRATDLRSMINDLISFQQDRAQEMEMGIVAIAEIAQVALQTTRTLAANPNYAGQNPHGFVFDCADDRLCVRANPAQLNQVFSNLLSNAMKFSPDGGIITLRVAAGIYQFEFENQEAGAPLFVGDPLPREIVELPAVFVSVQDQGIGIPAEELENIWLDFYQVDGSATRRFGGTGLGLALVRDIILAHGGAVWAESRLNAGTTVTFVIPRSEGKPA